ncbi:energy-coupling factor transporter transmembrane protein EcfT [bacterium]|nr:energy-coupling factor transporter transmembrane protein EcfT [bacterium]
MQKSLYIEKNTPLQRLDPRTKIIGLCLIFLMSVIITNILFLAAILFILVLLIIYSGSIKNLLSIKWLVIVISVMSIIFWLPTRSLIHGITVALRLDIMIITGILFVSCIRVEEFSSGLNRLGLPYRVAFAVSLAFRLIPSIFSIIQTTADAQQTRGLNLKEGNIIKKVRKYVPLFIPVISLLVRDAHQLSMALESKGFGFANKRTNYTEHAMEAPDYIALTMLLLCLVASLIIR